MCSSVSLAVNATLVDTVNSGCSSREKTCAPSKSESLTTFVSGTYSRKVFIGGLPPDLDADDIQRHFAWCGALQVDWPYRTKSRALFPPKGYVFLLFGKEISVHKLLLACLKEDGKYFVHLSSASLTAKKAEVRPWLIADSKCLCLPEEAPDPRKTVFIGGVPRPMKACELADIMDKRFGKVSFAAIDLDTDVNYPKGAGRVSFSSTNSFMVAVASRFFQMTYGEINKRVEVKPYVTFNQMCDECHGVKCDRKFAPFFCGSISCLQYYCEYCWTTVHALPTKRLHCPITKDTSNHQRAMPFVGEIL